MKLAPNEAADIADYLLRSNDLLSDRDPIIAPSTDTTLVETGRQLFATLGCANCHRAGEITSRRFKPLQELDLMSVSASCLVEGTGGATYGLDSAQTSAIHDAIDGLKSHPQVAAGKPERGNHVERTLLQMNCYGCHARGGLGGVGRYRKGYFETVSKVDLGDEGRLPPPLTGVGSKLKPAWLKRVFRGDPKTTLRPHMTIRMPVFPHDDVMALAEQLGDVDGANPAPASEVFATTDAGAETRPNGEIGRRLMEIGCIECHEFDSQAMPGVIGVDLTGVPERVFPSWFRDFVMNPGQIKNRTRMPTFFPDGKSQVPQVLEGDASKQIAAMWEYLANHKHFGIPDKIAAQRAKNYQLTPTDHPLMLRTFMNGVGMHAIAAGFPAGIHFAVDARTGRLAIGWRRDFVDARSTWFERFSPPIDPLDPESQQIDEGPSFFTIDQAQGMPVAAPVEFLGYQLRHDRVPTFRYRCGGYQIEDRIVPDEGGGLRRQISLHRDKKSDEENDTNELWFRVIEGDHVTQEKEHRFRNESGLSVSLLDPHQSPVHSTHWMIRLNVSEDLELIYQWQ